MGNFCSILLTPKIHDKSMCHISFHQAVNQLAYPSVLSTLQTVSTSLYQASIYLLFLPPIFYLSTRLHQVFTIHQPLPSLHLSTSSFPNLLSIYQFPKSLQLSISLYQATSYSSNPPSIDQVSIYPPVYLDLGYWGRLKAIGSRLGPHPPWLQGCGFG